MLQAVNDLLPACDSDYSSLGLSAMFDTLDSDILSSAPSWYFLSLCFELVPVLPDGLHTDCSRHIFIRYFEVDCKSPESHQKVDY